MVTEDSKILLGMKKRGFGEGRWNGFGGKVEEGESIEEAARRELNEEIGIRSEKMQKRGILEFSFENDPKVLEVHVFGVSKFTGMPQETEEMRPQWFGFDEIPYPQMWSDDEFWLPLFLKGSLFRGAFLFDKPSTAEYSAKIISKHLEEVATLV